MLEGREETVLKSATCPEVVFAAVTMYTTMDREIIEGFVLSSKFCLPPHELSVVYHLVLGLVECMII